MERIQTPKVPNVVKKLTESNNIILPYSNKYFIKPEAEYFSYKLLLGVDEYKSVVKVPIKNSFRMLIIGRTGSGKTFLTRAIWNRFYKSGGSVAILTDVKGEYGSSKRPVQKDFAKYLGKNEEPEGFPVVEYYPYFLYKDSKRDLNFCQIHLSDISFEEFLTLLDLNKLSDAKYATLENCFNRERKKENPSLRGLKKEIEKYPVQTATKRSLFRSLEFIEKSGVLGEKYPSPDFAKDIMEDKIPILNLVGYEMQKKYSKFYVGIVLKRLIEAKRDKKISPNKKMLIVIDELEDFCPRKIDNSISKTEIVENLRKSRAWKVYMLFSTQRHTHIDSAIFNQCRYVLFPGNLTLKEAVDIFKNKVPSEYDYGAVMNKNISDLLSEMKKFWWCLIDSDEREDPYIVFKPLSPLSRHKTEY